MTAYYNELDPKKAAWLRELIKRGHIAPGVVDERSIEDVKADDLEGFSQHHFFSGVGGWSLALRLAGWARRSIRLDRILSMSVAFRARASNEAMPITDTSGPLFIASSPSARLQWCLASKLRQNLDVNGSPEYALTWKELDMPSGVPICALRASARRTSGNACSGWPTPDASAMNIGEGLETFQARQKKLKAKHMNGNGAGMPLAIAAQLAGWPTPQESWASAGSKCRSGDRSDELLIGGIVRGLAGWATPTVQDAANCAGPSQWDRNSWPPNVQAAASGLTSISSPAQMEKRGALNPAFSCWLMGYPPDWCDCAVTAMQSCLRSRKRSSAV